MSRFLQRLGPHDKGFWFLALASLAGYLLLSRWFPLRPYFNISPSSDIGSLAPSLREASLYAVLFLTLYGFYGLAYRQIRKGGEVPLAAILLVAAAFCVPLIFTFPINATDAYRYFIRGRISSVHGQSPFTVPASSLVDDPYLPLAGEWAAETSPYGPVWELTAAAVSALTPDNLWAALVLFKMLAALAHLGAGGLIWLSLAGATPVRRSALTLAWAWNPALLFIFAMNGHNDALMLVWFLLGWWFMQKGQVQLGMIVMLLAPLTKPIGLLPLPFFFIAGWQQFPDIRKRYRYLLLTLLFGLLFMVLAFLPFGSPFELARRLISEAGSGGGFSALALFFLEARQRGYDPSIQVATRGGSLFLFLLAIWLMWQTWRGRSPLRAAADSFGGYILQAFRFRIWYAAWPFPWLLLDRGQNIEDDPASKARMATGLVFLLTSQLSVLIFGQVRKELLGSSQLRAHWIGVSFTILLPLLVGLVVGIYSARSRERQRER